MKRVDLVRHLEDLGCYLLRDKGKHSVYANPSRGLSLAFTKAECTLIPAAASLSSV